MFCSHYVTITPSQPCGIHTSCFVHTMSLSHLVSPVASTLHVLFTLCHYHTQPCGIHTSCFVHTMSLSHSALWHPHFMFCSVSLSHSALWHPHFMFCSHYVTITLSPVASTLHVLFTLCHYHTQPCGIHTSCFVHTMSLSHSALWHPHFMFCSHYVTITLSPVASTLHVLFTLCHYHTQPCGIHTSCFVHTMSLSHSALWHPHFMFCSHCVTITLSPVASTLHVLFCVTITPKLNHD